MSTLWDTPQVETTQSELTLPNGMNSRQQKPNPPSRIKETRADGDLMNAGRRLKSRLQERNPPARIILSLRMEFAEDFFADGENRTGFSRKLSYNKSIVHNVIVSLTMNPSDEITLKAFVTALNQLDEPLPPNIQKHLNEVGKQIENSPNAIAYLEAVAPQYPSLNTAYQKARIPLQADANERNKGKTDPMPPLPDETSQELTNRAIAIFQASNSVEAAKVAIAKDNKGGFQRLVAFFKKSPGN